MASTTASFGTASQAILRIIQQEPGLDLVAIARKGPKKHNLDYHLKRLEGSGQIYARVCIGVRRYFPSSVRRDDALVVGFLVSEYSREVILSLLKVSKASDKEVSRGVRVLEVQLKFLTDAGLVRECGDRTFELVDSSRVRSVIDRHFPDLKS